MESAPIGIINCRVRIDHLAADPRFPAREICNMTIRTLFQRWRLRIGCFTLFTSCVLTAVSIRTSIVVDEMCMHCSNTQRVWLESHRDGISLIRYEWTMIGVCLPDPIGWRQRTPKASDGGFVSDLPIPPFEVRRRLHFLGFEFAYYWNPSAYARATCLTVPFIPSIVALTFVSAVLICNRGRQARVRSMIDEVDSIEH